MFIERIGRAGSAWLLAVMVATFAALALALAPTPAWAQPASNLPEVCTASTRAIVVHVEHDVPLRKVAACVWEGHNEGQASAFLNDTCGAPEPRALNVLPTRETGPGEMSLRAVTELRPTLFRSDALPGVTFISAANIVCAPGNEHAFEASYHLVRRVPADAGVSEDGSTSAEDAGFVREEERGHLRIDCARVLANPTAPRRWFHERVPHGASIYVGARGGHDLVLPRGGIARPTESACRALTVLATDSANEHALTTLKTSLKDAEPVDVAVRAFALDRVTDIALELARRAQTPAETNGDQPVQVRTVYAQVDDPEIRRSNQNLVILAIALSALLVLAVVLLVMSRLSLKTKVSSAFENGKMAGLSQGSKEGQTVVRAQVAPTMANCLGLLQELASAVVLLLHEDDIRRTTEMNTAVLARTAINALPELAYELEIARRVPTPVSVVEDPPLTDHAGNVILPPPSRAPTLLPPDADPPDVLDAAAVNDLVHTVLMLNAGRPGEFSGSTKLQDLLARAPELLLEWADAQPREEDVRALVDAVFIPLDPEDARHSVKSNLPAAVRTARTLLEEEREAARAEHETQADFVDRVIEAGELLIRRNGLLSAAISLLLPPSHHLLLTALTESTRRDLMDAFWECKENEARLIRLFRRQYFPSMPPLPSGRVKMVQRGSPPRPRPITLRGYPAVIPSSEAGDELTNSK